MNFKLKSKLVMSVLLLYSCKSDPNLESNIRYIWGKKIVDSTETDRGIYYGYSYDSVLFEIGEKKFIFKNGYSMKHSDSLLTYLWFDYDAKLYSTLSSVYRNKITLKKYPYTLFFKSERRYIWVLENENLEFNNLIVDGKMYTRVSVSAPKS